MERQDLFLVILVALIVGVLAGAVTTIALNQTSEEAMIKEFYEVEVASSVSPSDYVREGRGAIVVDLRDQASYEKLHLGGAINIPASRMNEEELVNSFKELGNKNEIITYCYSSYCMLSRKVGKALAEKGVYVKHFTAGWYEINRDFEDYLVSGSEPGVLKKSTSETCDVNGTEEFSC